MEVAIKSFRLNKISKQNLNALAKNLDLSSSEVIRRSILTFKRLHDLQLEYGRVKIVTENGNEIFLLN